MLRKLTAAAAMLAMVSPCGAQMPVVDAPPVAGGPAKGPAADVSAFQHCDGSKGHAGLLESLAGAVIGGGSLGLISAPLDRGSVDNRYKGLDGVAACNAAIAQEENELRKAELGVARTVHYVEANDLSKALESARDIRALAGSKMQDAGFRQAIGSATSILEANLLVRMNRPADAEKTALRVMEYSPYDVMALRDALRYMRLVRGISPDKRAYLDQYSRIRPEALIETAQIFANNGEYKDAAANIEAYSELAAAFFDDWSAAPAFGAMRAAYLTMAGDIAGGNALADSSASQLDAMIASGKAARMTNTVAMADEHLVFQRIARLAAAGDAAKARGLFALKERWANIPAGAVADMSARLRLNAKPSELVGGLESEPAAIEAAGLGKYIAAFTADPKSVEALYSSLPYYMAGNEFSSAASRTWKVGEKPGFLMKNVKGVTRFEVVSSENRVLTLAAGPILLLHCALIAQSRGKNSFAVLPARRDIAYFGVRFGNIGEAGFPARGVMMVDRTIADLSRLIPQPPPKK